jgi:hypothetical protein
MPLPLLCLKETSMKTTPSIAIFNAEPLRAWPASSLITVLFLTVSSWANAQHADAGASNPKSVVPTVTYRSVFRETSLGIEQEKTDWRKANSAVGRFERGHVDILKSEEMDEKKAPAPRPSVMPVTPVTPGPTPAPTPGPTPAPKNNSTHRH